MAFVTGNANSISDLLLAIQNACTANGWTQSASGAVLYKGTCYAELKVSGSTITIRGGSGVDGSGNLTGAANTSGGNLGGNIAAGDVGTIVFAFPVTYFVHVLTGPDEVYVVVNYATTTYQQIAWGQSAMPGLSGNGNWYSGCGLPGPEAFAYYIGVSGSGDDGSSYPATSILCRSTQNGVNHSLDSATWAIAGAWRDWASLFFREPNQWNQESMLIPIRVYANRPSGYVSPVLECAHARYVNIANLSDQQVITLGTDKWKVYPWWRRVAGNTGGNHNGSGFAGHAIRYDGP